MDQEKSGEFRLQILGQTVRHDTDELADTVVQGIFDQNLQFNRGASRMVFYSDKIRFKEQGYREYIRFNQISHFYESSERPEVFMIHVVDKLANRSYYESYQCQTPEEVRSIRDILYSASKNPVHQFREVSFTNRSWSSGSSCSSPRRSGSIKPQESQRLQRSNLRNSTHSTSSKVVTTHPPYMIPVRPKVEIETPRIVRPVHNHPGLQDHVSRSRVRTQPVTAYRAVSAPRATREPHPSLSPSRYRTSVIREQYAPVSYPRARSVYLPVRVQPTQSQLTRSGSKRRSGRKEPLIIYAPR